MASTNLRKVAHDEKIKKIGVKKWLKKSGYIRKLKRAAEKKTGRYFRLQRPFGRLYDPL